VHFGTALTMSAWISDSRSLMDESGASMEFGAFSFRFCLAGRFWMS